jgi:aspartate kinase
MADSGSALIVLKFGGTCLADPDGRASAARHCAEEAAGGGRVVAVVSAMGRKGDAYATDTLLGLVSSPLPDEKACLLACGEVIAASVMADTLRTGGLRAAALTGWSAGLLTDGPHCDTGIASIDPGRILDALDGNDCVVIAGFQGLGTDGGVSVLGRGGSDITAAALAVALGADRMVLYKTVDSVYTADPVRVPGALKVERISAEDLRQMAWQGAEVVHPRASEIASEAGIPIEIRTHGSGRRVTVVEPFILRSGRYITGVASGPPVAQFTVNTVGDGPLHDFYARVFGLVADAGVSMDMFSVVNGLAMFTVPLADRSRVSSVLDGAGFSHSFVEGCSKVSIVGAGMHGMKGVMARFASALAAAGIDMLQTVDSHATISALVRISARDEALQTLHHEFVE